MGWVRHQVDLGDPVRQLRDTVVPRATSGTGVTALIGGQVQPGLATVGRPGRLITISSPSTTSNSTTPAPPD
jgi:hypothetical protein